MATTPTRLQVGTDWEGAIPLLNDNFENVIQDIRDLGANLSTIGTLAVTIPTTSLVASVFTLTSPSVTSTSANQVFTQKPVSSVTGITPFVDVYIDTDNDPSYLFPLGAGLTTGQKALFMGASTANTTYTNSLAAWVIQLNNRDSASHTYYIHTRCGYLPTGVTGYLR